MKKFVPPAIKILARASLCLVMLRCATELSTTAIAGEPVLQIPFELLDNRVFLQVELNGKGPFLFILDNGAAGSNVIESGLLKELGLTTENTRQETGAGEQSQSFDRTHIQSVRIGSIELRDQIFDGVSLQPLARAIGFRRLDGILGDAVFLQYVIAVDFDRSLVLFYKPGEYIPPKEATAVSFKLYQSVPVCDASFGSTTGRFVIDLGDRFSLTLFGPFWRTNHLQPALPSAIEAMTGYGIGGPVKGLVTRIQALTLGSGQVKAPITRLSLQKAGLLADAAVAGNIGTGILKHFNTVFDYPNGRILLIRNAGHDVVEPYDRSGMWLGQGDSYLEVLDVVPGGPAEEAGIRQHDSVVAVDGIPASQIDLLRLRERLRSAEVKQVMITFKHDTAHEIKAPLHLRDIVRSSI